ncbi:MAG: type II toxin-antitoxin system VapC family toxin [Hymenobacter sp.]|nr:MAG: type II toxin-antitoxin system VapC family toxin [Hymenobacter sp.]
MSLSRYLVDTHTLLWYSQQVSPLPASLLVALRELGATTYISRVSLLEITIKYSLGKLQLPDPLRSWLRKTTEVGFRMLEITDEHLVYMASLPLLPNHRDPFDRLLIAQALSEGLTLVSRDGKFAAYAGVGLRTQWA